MALFVQKFGGTSVPDVGRVQATAAMIAARRARGDAIVVTVSAMGDETDRLLRMAPDSAGRRADRERDVLVTVGERKAMALMGLALERAGIPAQSFSGAQAGIITDSDWGDANLCALRVAPIVRALAAGCVPVVGGAQGVSTEGDETFLGRGGTDTTAVALAAALDADDVCAGEGSAPLVVISDRSRAIERHRPHPRRALVSVIGPRVHGRSGICGRTLAALEDAAIGFAARPGSGLRLTVAVEPDAADAAVRAIHTALVAACPSRSQARGAASER